MVEGLRLFTAQPMIIYNWADEAKAELNTVLAPAAIPITFLCNGVALFVRKRRTSGGERASSSPR